MDLARIIDQISPWEPGLLGLVLFTAAVMLAVGAVMVIAAVLGEKKPGTDKLRPYESGIIPFGSARFKYPLPFFLVAIFFLIFDVEGSFIFSWAVTGRSLGWRGWFQMTFFILVLLLGLIYIWRKGGLSWSSKRNPE
jgi:NADH-quinone oxidoreductase subunit A